ncbi:hypothetical protein BB560_005106 [Smittium megazygosporum]|uniref:Uncharacterized protein n=1 Tax=Smittium megazygosporum TaxID=133381 RepID=A0A2T9Z7D6_9FUNG|nr:hypothetical protein BB560_005106 [Smittium megazygosporum]
MKVFDLKYQYVKYGEYHSHPINVLQHQIFVPLIVWSSLGFLSLTPSFFSFPIPEMFKNVVFPNWALAMYLIYSVYYFILDAPVSLLYAPIQGFMLVTSSYVAHYVAYGKLILGIVYILSWVIQVNGHYVYEKRAPALLDNLPQAFIMAPFFVFLEGLFSLGFKKEFHDTVEKEIKIKVDAFHKSKKQ